MIWRLKSWDTLAVVVLAAWRFLFYLPVTLGQKAFVEGDINWLFLPARTELARALAEGRLPLWTPSLEAGFPLYAEGEVAALYPLNLIFHALFPAPLALSYTILINFAWAAVGMYLLCRSCEVGPAGAFLGGFIFGHGGFLTAQLSHVTLVAAGAWLPWLLFLQREYWRARRKGTRASTWFVFLCVSIGLQFLGFPQIAFLNSSIYVVSGILYPWLERDDASSSSAKHGGIDLLAHLHATVFTLTTMLFGLALAAVQLLPTYELLTLSIRAQEVGRSFFTSYSLDPWALTQFVSPFWRLGYPIADNMEYLSYVGILPISIGLLAPFLRRVPRTWLFFLIALFSLLLALGEYTPLYGWLYYLPVFNRFRVPARFLFLFTFSIGFLAAVGFDELKCRLPLRAGFGRISQMLVTATVALVAGIIYLVYSESVDSWTSVWQWLSPLLGLLSTLLLFLAFSRRTDRVIWGTLVIGLAIVDLTAYSATLLPGLGRMAYPAEIVQIPRTASAMAKDQPPYRVIVDKSPYTISSMRATLARNLALLYNQQSVNSYLPSLGLRRNDEFIQGMTLPMRNLMNIRYYLLPLETLPYGEPLPSPLDESEPYGGLTLSVLKDRPSIPPTRVVQVEITSFTDQTSELSNGSLAGELVLSSGDGKFVTFPIRLGMETADWAFDGLLNVNHTKPSNSISFPAYTSSVGHDFVGHKYVAHYDVASNANPMVVTAIGLRSLLPGAGLTIERIALIDEMGHSSSLTALLHRTDLALVFRSHTAAMWENRDVLPRAFMVYQREVVQDGQMLERMKAPDFDPARLVLLNDSPGVESLDSAVGEDAQNQVTIVEYKPERAGVNVKTTRPGYLVLTDSWYPGWVAWVDGQKTPIYQADYIFRSIKIEPGEHRVEFEFHSESFAWGLGTSLFSIASLAVLAIVGQRWI